MVRVPPSFQQENRRFESGWGYWRHAAELYYADECEEGLSTLAQVSADPSPLTYGSSSDASANAPNTPSSWNTELRLMPSCEIVKIWRVWSR